MEPEYMNWLRDYDLEHVLGYYSDLIKYTYTLHLPSGMFNRVQATRIEVLRVLQLLDDDLALRGELRDVIADVIGNRDIGVITNDDIRAIASRHREWFPPDSPIGRWSNAAYDARSALSGHAITVATKGPWPSLP
jgi:hypothetical protein